jgi:hypothetical protein
MRPIHAVCLCLFVACALPLLASIFVLGLIGLEQRVGLFLPTMLGATAVCAAFVGGCFEPKK